MIHSLPLFHRIAGERVVVVGEGEMAAAKRRMVERAGGTCCNADQGARLAFVALDDRASAEAAAAQLKARGLLVNVADRPELCDFTLPSVLERGDVLIAVSTGGASAGLAKHLRLRLEALLPSSLGALANALKGARDALRSRWPDPNTRRRALDEALAEDGPLDPFDENSHRRIDSWLAEPHIAARSKTIEIELASHDPDELTLRQARLLGAADVVVHDPGVPSVILSRARADALRLPAGGTVPSTSGLIVAIRMKG